VGHTQSETRVTIAETRLDSIPTLLNLNHSALKHRINVPSNDRKHLLNVLPRLRRSLEEVETAVARRKPPTFGLRHRTVFGSHIGFVADDRIDSLAG